MTAGHSSGFPQRACFISTDRSIHLGLDRVPVAFHGEACRTASSNLVILVNRTRLSAT